MVQILLKVFQGKITILREENKQKKSINALQQNIAQSAAFWQKN